MNQREFTQRYQSSWDEFETLLDALAGSRKQPPPDAQMLASFAHRYRRVSQQLALARDRNSLAPGALRRKRCELERSLSAILALPISCEITRKLRRKGWSRG